VRNTCKHRYSIETRNYLPVLVCLNCGAAWKPYAPTWEGVPVSADLPNLRGNPMKTMTGHSSRAAAVTRPRA
jgi:hypothetical protein